MRDTVLRAGATIGADQPRGHRIGKDICKGCDIIDLPYSLRVTGRLCGAAQCYHGITSRLGSTQQAHGR